MAVLENNSVTQENLTAFGDIAARDINKITNIFAPIVYREDLVLKRLLQEHEAEKQKDPDYREFSDELNKFLGREIKNELRNLEEKLKNGNREYLIDVALECKERVTKKINQYCHYKSAQEIYTYLLTNIRTAFLHEVQSKIESGKFEPYQIDEIVIDKIIEPFLQNLQGSSLNIDKNELYGVLYFLTGNCYIRWD